MFVVWGGLCDYELWGYECYLCYCVSQYDYIHYVGCWVAIVFGLYSSLCYLQHISNILPNLYHWIQPPQPIMPEYMPIPIPPNLLNLPKMHINLPILPSKRSLQLHRMPTKLLPAKQQLLHKLPNQHLHRHPLQTMPTLFTSLPQLCQFPQLYFLC